MLWPFLRCYLPYPDLLRRIRVRGRARNLVICEPWPGEDARGEDAAQLALLRLLWLQRATRRAVRWRRREEAALLARAVVECLLLGLYCLHAEDAVERLEAAENKAVRDVLAFLSDENLFSRESIAKGADALGQPRRGLAWVDIAKLLQREQGLDAAVGLYRRYYVPLSEFYAHPGSFTLLRHARPDRQLRRRPVSPWARRSAARLADGCTGWLAAALTEQRGQEPEMLLTYAAAHLDRALNPAAGMAAREMGRTVRSRQVFGAVRSMRELRAYLDGPAASDDPAQCEDRIRRDLGRALALVQGQVPLAAYDAVIEELVGRLLAEVTAQRVAGPGDVTA